MHVKFQVISQQGRLCSSYMCDNTQAKNPFSVMCASTELATTIL